MNCKSARKRFSLRIDGDMSFEEQRRLAEHLESCPTCDASFRSFERTVSLVRGLPPVDVPDTFVQDVLLSVRQARAAQVAPPRAGFRERLDAFFERFTWVTSSPRLAPAALVLGVGVGLFGAFVVLRPAAQPVVAQRGAPAAEARVQPSGSAPTDAMMASGAGVAPSTPSEVPSQPLKDLIRDLVAREEANPPATADSAAPDLDWGTATVPDLSRQVTTQRPSTTARDPDRSGRVSIVF